MQVYNEFTENDKFCAFRIVLLHYERSFSMVKQKRKQIQKEDDDMSMIIEEIIRIQQSDSCSFIQKQQKRLYQLKAIEHRKKSGKKIQKNRIIKELQASGILDEGGNLSKNYY